MSKELPYFKFNPSRWMTGDITLCSMEAQGVFANVCSFYWEKECSMSLANAKQRFSKYEASLNELLHQEIIKVNEEGNLIIEFLDEQMSEFVNISQKRSLAGQKGGQANAKQQPSKCQANANILREDKEKDKDINKGFFESEKLNSVFKDFLEMRKKIKKPATPKAIELLVNKLKKLSCDEAIQIQILEQSIMSSWQDLYALKQPYGNKNSSSSTNSTIEARKQQEDYGTFKPGDKAGSRIVSITAPIPETQAAN